MKRDSWPDEEVDRFLNSPYKLPSPRETPKEILYQKIETLPSLAAANSQLNVAQYTGAAIGEYVRSTEHSMVKQKIKITNLKCALAEKEDALAEKESDLNEIQEQFSNVTEEKNTLLETNFSLNTSLKEQEEKHRAMLKEFRPKNVKRREDTKVKHIKQLTDDKRDQQLMIDVQREQITSLQAENENLTEKVRLTSHEKLNAQKLASKWRQKCKSNPDSQIPDLTQQIKFLENENTMLREQLEEHIEGHILKTKNGRIYTNDVRQTYYQLAAKGVPVSKIDCVVKTVLNNITDIDTTNVVLPRKSSALNFMAEAAALAKIQCGVELLNCSNNTLQTDGSKKKFREFATINATSGSGESLSLGFKEMSGGTSEDYLASVLDTLYEIADLLLKNTSRSQLEKDKLVAKLLKNFTNVMSDRLIVNKCMNNALDELRQNFMSLIQDGDIPRLNQTFCAAHVVINMGTVAKDTCKEFEDICEHPNPRASSATAHTFDILWACSKSLTQNHNYQKAGVLPQWKAYMEERGKKDHLVSLKGERINMMFVLAAALYHHRADITDFLEDPDVQNKLTLSLKPINDPVISSLLRACGIIGTSVTSPLFKAISEAENILDMNNIFRDILHYMDLYSQRPDMLMEQHSPPTIHQYVIKNGVFSSLFLTENNENEEMTKQAIKLLSISLAILLKRQVQDHLPGGALDKPSEKLKDELKNCPSTNLATERDFSHLDRIIAAKPNITLITLTGITMYMSNRTGPWLDSLSTEKRDQYMESARRNAKQMKEKYKQDGKKIREKLIADRKARKDKKEEKEVKKAETTESLIQKVSLVGGLWKTQEEIQKRKQTISEKQFRNEVVDQIKLRKLIGGRKVPTQKFYLSEKGKPLPLNQLEDNLLCVIKAETIDTGASATPAPVDVAACTATIEAQVSLKRAQLSETKEQKAKKPKISFINKRIQHKWNDTPTSISWYEGYVTQAFGKEPHCLYEVKYSGDDALYEVELYEDYLNKDVVIIGSGPTTGPGTLNSKPSSMFSLCFCLLLIFALMLNMFRDECYTTNKTSYPQIHFSIKLGQNIKYSLICLKKEPHIKTLRRWLATTNCLYSH